MNTKAAKLFAAQLRLDLPTLDLHGFSTSVALDKMDFFVYNSYQKKEAAVKIIYGIGTGKLGEAVLVAARLNPLVEDVAEQPGFCIALLQSS